MDSDFVEIPDAEFIQVIRNGAQVSQIGNAFAAAGSLWFVADEIVRAENSAENFTSRIQQIS